MTDQSKVAHGHDTHEELDPARLHRRFLEHLKSPCNMGRLPSPHGRAEMIGQCGDSIGVEIEVQDGIVREIGVQPHGCGYTTACASAMSSLVKGRSLDDALWLEPDEVAAELGGLPEDHLHCARLAVNTLGEAIADYYQRHLRDDAPSA